VEVSEFKYLGRTISSDTTIDREIKERVNAGRRVLGGTKGIMKSQVLSTEARVAVYKGVLVPTLLCGAEIWTTQSAHRSKVNAVGMDYLRGMCGVKRIDRVRNDEVCKEDVVSPDQLLPNWTELSYVGTAT